MAHVDLHIREDAEKSLATLDNITRGDPHAKEKFTTAVQTLIGLRDELIDARRRGEEDGARLERMNGIVSATFGLEFPSGGLQWKRLQEARDALRRLLDDSEGTEIRHDGDCGQS